jgi:hypothetical protein
MGKKPQPPTALHRKPHVYRKIRFGRLLQRSRVGHIPLSPLHSHAARSQQPRL